MKFRLAYSDMNICFLYFFDFLREDQDNDKNSDDENEGKFFTGPLLKICHTSLNYSP